MKKLLILCCTLFLLMAAGCQVSQEPAQATPTPETLADDGALGYEVLRIGMEAAYPPNNWQEDSASDTNEPISNIPGAYADGYDVRVAQYLRDELGVEVEIVKLAWEGLIEALNNGQIDLILAGMADTAERKESIDFSAVYGIPSEYCIMVSATSEYAEATTLSDFSGAAVLGQQSTQYDVVIDQIPDVDHVTAVSDVANMILRLREGTVDGLVFDEKIASSYVEAYPGEFTIVYFEEGQGFDKGFSGACIGVRKGETGLTNALNEALNKLDITTRNTWMSWAQENMPK